nr:MAG TPA: hypothetical protein [Caudoviricetes sp.]
MCHTTVMNFAVHNWKRTPSVTNRSPPERRGMRFHVVVANAELQLLPCSSDIFGRGAKGVISPYP